ncbi:unnamed protein product [Lathyrus sativus]|nr:unnamed protein product [Lathyrus sativus]
MEDHNRQDKSASLRGKISFRNMDNLNIQRVYLTFNQESTLWNIKRRVSSHRKRGPDEAEKNHAKKGRRGNELEEFEKLERNLYQYRRLLVVLCPPSSPA